MKIAGVLEYARRQGVIADFGRRALSGLPTTALLRAALSAIVETLDVELCELLELEPGGRNLILLEGIGWNAAEVGVTRLPVGRGSQAGYTLQTGKTVIAGNLPTERRFAWSGLRKRHGVTSGITVVLPGPHRPLGVLGAHSREPRRFTRLDTGFLEGMATVLAVAIVRKREETARRELLESALLVQDEERRNVSRELHDQAGQALTSLLVGLRAVADARTLRSARERALRLRPFAAQVLEDVGRVARGLHPSTLDELGLVSAVRRYAREYGALHGIAVRVTTGRLDQERLPHDVEIALFRIMQEALTNTARHAGASRVDIALNRGDGAVHLMVRDNGCGFERRRLLTTPGHLGLLGIQERASMLSGAATIVAGRGRGTKVTVRLPLRPPRSNELSVS